MEWKKQMTRVGKALLASVLLTAILLFVMALILYKANLSGLAEHVMVILIYLLACLAGGFLLGKQEEKRRFLWGAGFGWLRQLLEQTCKGRFFPVPDFPLPGANGYGCF